MFWKTDFGFDDTPKSKPSTDQIPSKKIKLDNDDKQSSELLSFNVPKSFKNNSQQISWIDIYEPKIFSELIIHNKKLEELENALKNPTSKILLITGPSGSGKTTSLKCICKKLNIGIKEWICPLNISEKEFNSEYKNSYFDTKTSNLVEDFEHFLFQCNRKKLTDVDSTATSGNNPNYIILIKDISNVFLNDENLLYETINKYYSTIKYNLIFILNQEHIIYKLFPSNIIHKYNINQIKFNIINSTGLINHLSFILKKENINIDNSILINIINNSNGNLTYAINQLYFYTIKKDINVLKKQNKLTVKMLKENEKSTNKNLEKNKSINYFQNIGRILYPKKEIVDNSYFNEFKKTNMVYKNEDLFKFKYLPSELTSEFLTQPNKCINLLHENYVSKISNLKYLINISNNFSLIDNLNNFNNQNLINEINLNIIITSIMCNNNVVTSYAPLQKSNNYLIPNKNQLNNEIYDLFHDMFPSVQSKNIMFDVLSIIKHNPPSSIQFNNKQKEFIQENMFSIEK